MLCGGGFWVQEGRTTFPEKGLGKENMRKLCCGGDPWAGEATGVHSAILPLPASPLHVGLSLAQGASTLPGRPAVLGSDPVESLLSLPRSEDVEVGLGHQTAVCGRAGVHPGLWGAPLAPSASPKVDCNDLSPCLSSARQGSLRVGLYSVPWEAPGGEWQCLEIPELSNCLGDQAGSGWQRTGAPGWGARVLSCRAGPGWGDTQG